MSRKCNAVIIYLSRKQDINDLKKSLKLLHKYFNKRFNYPIIIFHDDFSEEDKQILLREYSNIKFEYIKFKIPSWIDKTKLYHKRLGYNHMCRFFSGELFKHSAIQNYDWYWRLDSDSYLRAHINYDIFKFMEKKKYIYGYLGEPLIKEKPALVKELWVFTKKYIKDNNLQPSYLYEYLDKDGNWDRSLYYTNFEISNLDFWRSNAYTKYYNAIDQNGGIYYHRWGDHVIHFLALSMLVDQNKIYCFNDIDYSHQDFRPNKKTLVITILELFMKSILYQKILRYILKIRFLKSNSYKKFLKELLISKIF